MFEKKFCMICRFGIKKVDYKLFLFLQEGFITYFNQIERREHKGTCLCHQKQVAKAIKRARHVALCGFVR